VVKPISGIKALPIRLDQFFNYLGWIQLGTGIICQCFAQIWWFNGRRCCRTSMLTWWRREQ